MSRLRKLILVCLVLSLVVVAHQTWRERTFGRGARDASGPVVGESLEIAFIGNGVDGTVSLLNLADQRILDTLDIKPDGRRVGLFRDPLQWLAQGFLESRGGLNYVQDTDLSRDGTALYVSRGFLGDVAAFDIDTGGMLWRTPVSGLRADHMTLSPDGRRLYVSALIFGGNVVEVLDAASGDKVGEFRAGQWPHDVHTNMDGSRVYVASLGNMLSDLEDRDRAADAYRVTVADAATLRVIRRHDFEAGVRPFAVTRREDRLYAQLSNAHAVVARDLVSGQPLARLELPVGKGVTEADWDFEAPHHGLALSPDDASLCIAARASDYAAILSTDPLAIRHLVPVGDAPSWAALDGSGERCILPNTRSNNVSIVSVAEGTELARVYTGRAPKHVSVGRVPARLLD
jgi:DNA-binding beta-propeller fold protein YncE